MSRLVFAEMASDRILSGEISRGEGCVHDRDEPRIGRVELAEAATADDRCADRFEVSRPHSIPYGRKRTLPRVEIYLRAPDAIGLLRGVQRQALADYAGDTRQAIV